MATNFSDKVAILGHLWAEYKYDENFIEFAEYNNLGLPLSQMIDMSLCQATEEGKQEINDTWDSLLDLVGIEDTGFEHIDDIFLAGEITIID